MFSHMMVGSNDIERSKKFYDATFAAMGGKPGNMDPKGRLIYAHNGSMFIVTPPINGEPATHGNGCTIGFAMTKEQADAWHDAGVEGRRHRDRRSAGRARRRRHEAVSRLSARSRRQQALRAATRLMETVSENRAHGGMQGVYRHASTATGTDMTFSVYVPPRPDAARFSGICRG